MSTVIRASISRKNKYYLNPHRYYELKHFCLQYRDWKKRYVLIDGYSDKSRGISGEHRTSDISNPTESMVEDRLFFSERIKMVENSAYETDPVIGKYILKGVIDGISYECLNARYQIPCCKNVYYELYRKFFWILDKKRM